MCGTGGSANQPPRRSRRSAAALLAGAALALAGLPAPLPNPATPHSPPSPTELTGRVRSAEQDAAYPREEGAHAAQVAALSAASAEAHENVDALNRQLQTLQAQRADIKAQVAALQRKADHIEQIVTDAEPRTRWVLVWRGVVGSGRGADPPALACAAW